MSYIEMQCKDCGLTEHAHFDSTRNFNDKKMVWCEHNYEPVLDDGLIAVKTSKIDAVIEFVNNKNSQGCFEYAIYSEIFNMLENLKKGER